MCRASVKRENNLEIIRCIRERNRDVIRDYYNYHSEINREVCEEQPGVLWHSQHINHEESYHGYSGASTVQIFGLEQNV